MHSHVKPCSLILFVVLLSVVPAAAVFADSAIGGWGHALSYQPRTHLYNPEGKAFTVTVHRFQLAMPLWNKPTTEITVLDPDGKAVVEGEFGVKEGRSTVEVPKGPRGTYVVNMKHGGWLSTSLDRAVLWTGDPTAHIVEGRRAVFQASVPRRWWFFVPEGVREFTVKAQRADRYMSQREDWGFFIVSPRGQRFAAIWGQPPADKRPYRQEQEARIVVEPGAGGRFWSLWVEYGDSHTYSNINIAFDGIPQYIARSPEEWFNPETGELANVKIYDDDPFIQSGRIEGMEEKWPNLQHFSPVPSLGDPDTIEVLGDAKFAIWNPEGRELGSRIGTYLPRTLRGEPDKAHVVITNADGGTVLDKQMPLEHIHGHNGLPTDTIDTGKGVSTVDVSGVERFFAYTYPATPLVLIGDKIGDGWQRFRVSSGTGRNWYFRVPEGTKNFSYRVDADIDTDIVRFQVCAPDRVLAMVYANEGSGTVKVPEGLDGKIWYLRPNVGSATRMITDKREGGRYTDLQLTIDLKGVPGYLAPSWEQWFDPDNPKHPHER